MRWQIAYQHQVLLKPYQIAITTRAQAVAEAAEAAADKEVPGSAPSSIRSHEAPATVQDLGSELEDLFDLVSEASSQLEQDNTDKISL